MSEKSKIPRDVVNYHDAEFAPYFVDGVKQEDLTWCNISWDKETGTGFFLMRFAPNGQSFPHQHSGIEEFILLEGDLVDNDGFAYKPGDCVHLPGGSKHVTTSKNGALVAVFSREGYVTIPYNEL